MSRKVEDEDTRKKLKSMAHGLDLPAGCGVILRTNALDQTKLTRSPDLAALLRLWKRVQAAAMQGKGTRLLYTDQDLILQALRDYLDTSIEEVLIDDDEAFQKAEAYLMAFMPRSKTRLVRYSERLPLFSRYDLEPQIDRIYERRVELQSGGSIVIDATEALTAIDVNSGRSTPRRDAGGDRRPHQRRGGGGSGPPAPAARRRRPHRGRLHRHAGGRRISAGSRKPSRTPSRPTRHARPWGASAPTALLEINRQRIQQALQLRTHRSCPTCNGSGRLASEEMVSLSLLRRIEARAASGAIQGVKIGLHPELADALQNHYRQELAGIEEELDVKIEIIATAGLHRPDERIEWQKREKPARVSKPQKPRPVILQAWDLALPEDEEDEDDLLEAGPATAQGREAQEPGAGGDDAAARKRRRRRGEAASASARHPVKTVPTMASIVASENGLEAGGGERRRKPRRQQRHPRPRVRLGSLRHRLRQGTARDCHRAPRVFYDVDGEVDGDDDEGPDDDFEDGPEDAPEGAEGADGTPGVPKKRRRRRRRRKA